MAPFLEGRDQFCAEDECSSSNVKTVVTEVQRTTIDQTRHTEQMCISMLAILKSRVRIPLEIGVIAAVIAGAGVHTASASPPNAIYLASSAGRQVQLNYAAVTQMNRAQKSLEIVRKNNSTVFTIVYSATTYFYGSRFSAIKVSTVLTIAGVHNGTTLNAQEISRRSSSGGGSSGSSGGSFGVSGPFTGLKYLGNV